MKKTEKSLLRSLQEAEFTLHELVLFLDTHPHDRKAKTLYDEYRRKVASLREQYDAQCAPLTAFSVKNGNAWTWASTPWPWQLDPDENGGKYHVDV